MTGHPGAATRWAAVLVTESVVVGLCVPADEGFAGDRLMRPQRDLSPVSWPGGGVEHHPGRGHPTFAVGLGPQPDGLEGTQGIVDLADRGEHVDVDRPPGLGHARQRQRATERVDDHGRHLPSAR